MYYTSCRIKKNLLTQGASTFDLWISVLATSTARPYNYVTTTFK